VKFIVDFRDLWTGDSEITSFSSLSKKRILHEQFFERRTILQADVVLTVGEQMSRYFDSLAINKKVYTLPNGFDEDDINIYMDNLERQRTANLNEGEDPIQKYFTALLNKLKSEQSPEEKVQDTENARKGNTFKDMEVEGRKNLALEVISRLKNR
jgi:hypothetical protein